MQSIDRREAIRRATLLLGAVSASTVVGVLSGCGDSRGANVAWTPRVLTAEETELVAVVGEHIIPTTDTPGARAALVHRFIDTMLADYYTPAERQLFVRGLADLDARARSMTGAPFARCTPAQQRATLDAVDQEAFAVVTSRSATDAARETEHHYFRTMKELVILGYYTCEVGATRELRYERVPGRFDGCVPLSKVGRTWAVS
jgi:gluconate 2-dehydrogenase gamma chain